MKGYDRVARLEEVRADPLGWGHIDLGTLLAAWDFRRKPLHVSHGVEHWLYIHRDYDDLRVVLPAADGIAKGTVEHVVSIIDSARRLSAQGE